jgi:hypothetical protein
MYSGTLLDSQSFLELELEILVPLSVYLYHVEL